MSDLLQVSDLEKAKLHDTFHSEVITGKAGGLSGGADIDYTTNAATGQVQKTLPKILADIDWSYVGLFADGVTFTKRTDFALDAVGIQWVYVGTYPFAATAGTVPSAPLYQVVHVRDHNSFSNINAVGGHDAIYNRTFINLASALEQQFLTSSIGTTINVIERFTGNGGGSFWTVALSSEVIDNGMDIITCTADSYYSLKILGYDGDIKKLGANVGIPINSIVARSFTITKNAFLPANSFTATLSAAIDIPEDCTINLNGNEIAKQAGFAYNSIDTIFRHIGSNGVVMGVSYPDISATERLIGYEENAKNCKEYGCFTGRGSKGLIRFQGVSNNNYSESLHIGSLGKVQPKTSVMVMEAIVNSTNGINQFHRVRHLPSRCTIVGIKVTDVNGSPNFYFDLAMRKGSGFVYPYIRPAATSNINSTVNIDWFYDSFDDILSFGIINSKGTNTQFKVEISYVDANSGRDDIAWSYQSTSDFNRPHNYGATSILGAVRTPEFRSFVVGSGLDVRGAPTTRSTFFNYGFPMTTIPTPSGSQDVGVGTTSELKFYFNYSAEMALSSGATHLRFRLYQQTRQIKCTCINGFLSQKPDWATGDGHLAASFQPDIEVDLVGATRDLPQEVLIPLDVKGMMNATIESREQDLKYFYLTFYQNLAGHVPILWGDEWEWECDFIKL